MNHIKKTFNGHFLLALLISTTYESAIYIYIWAADRENPCDTVIKYSGFYLSLSENLAGLFDTTPSAC